MRAVHNSLCEIVGLVYIFRLLCLSTIFCLTTQGLPKLEIITWSELPQFFDVVAPNLLLFLTLRKLRSNRYPGSYYGYHEIVSEVEVVSPIWQFVLDIDSIIWVDEYMIYLMGRVALVLLTVNSNSAIQKWMMMQYSDLKKKLTRILIRLAIRLASPKSNGRKKYFTENTIFLDSIEWDN